MWPQLAKALELLERIARALEDLVAELRARAAAGETTAGKESQHGNTQR